MVIYVVRLYLPDGSNADRCRRRVIKCAPALAPGTPGAQLALGLLAESVDLDPDVLLAGKVQEVGPLEVVVFKPRWGAFFETPLLAQLDKAGVTTVVFAGCNFPNCPRTSTYEASERDYRIGSARAKR
jgi:nicotinamidase-related amidase